MTESQEPVKPKPPLGRYRATRIALWSWALPVMVIGGGLALLPTVFHFLPQTTVMGSRVKVIAAMADVIVLLSCTAGLILGCWGVSQVPKHGTKRILIPSIVGLVISIAAFALVVVSHTQGWRTKF